MGDIIVADEPGFACSKTRLVEDGLIHLRPFNISPSGVLLLDELYQVPPSAAPVSRAKIEAGDILFNNTNSAELVGKSALVTEPMAAGFSNHLSRIRVDQSRIDPRWFALWLRRKRETGFFSKNATQWVSQAAYKTSELRKLAIVVPSLSTQRRVADLLSRAENIVRMRREAEQKAREIIPALFLDMFGDPRTNPKGWMLKSLGESSRIVGGSSLPKGDAFRGQEGGDLLVKVSDMNRPGNEIDLSHCAEWAPDATRSYSRVPAGAVVLPKRGAAIATNKKRLTTRSSLLDPNLMGIVPDENILLRRYLFQWFLRFDLATITSGTAVPQLNKGDLAPLLIPVPPQALQRQFSEQATRIGAIVKTAGDANKVARDTFQSLLAAVFGE